MDFRTEKQIGQDIRADFEQLHFTGGYDHNYVLGRPGEKKIMANAYCRESGIALEAATDCCGVQFYAGNFIGEQTGKMVQPITTEVHFVWSPSFIQMR